MVYMLLPGIALTIRIGFWGILYYNYNKQSPNPILIIKAPTLVLGVLEGFQSGVVIPKGSV